MKTQRLLNPVTGDYWFCDDMTRVKDIDGVQYISVYRKDSKQNHLMRKDALKRVENKR